MPSVPNVVTATTIFILTVVIENFFSRTFLSLGWGGLMAVVSGKTYIRPHIDGPVLADLSPIHYLDSS